MREIEIIGSGGGRKTNIVPDTDRDIVKALKTFGKVYQLFAELVV